MEAATDSRLAGWWSGRAHGPVPPTVHPFSRCGYKNLQTHDQAANAKNIATIPCQSMLSSHCEVWLACTRTIHRHSWKCQPRFRVFPDQQDQNRRALPQSSCPSPVPALMSDPQIFGCGSNLNLMSPVGSLGQHPRDRWPDACNPSTTTHSQTRAFDSSMLRASMHPSSPFTFSFLVETSPSSSVQPGKFHPSLQFCLFSIIATILKLSSNGNANTWLAVTVL